MKSLRRQLPPMTALMAFEAAARLLSFTRAAEELGVTQAAVSRQIHALEEDFGLPLFNRLHRKVTLTAQGQALAAATSNAFGLIADAASDLRQGSNDDLTISATVAFSHFWLLPRISEFSRRHPDTTLRIVSQDAMPALDQGDVDVAIRFGEGSWPNVHAEKLFETLASAQELGTAEDMGESWRIQLDARDLNYSAYFSEGDTLDAGREDYHSHNTERLDVEGVKQLLLSLPEVRAQLAQWKGETT